MTIINVDKYEWLVYLFDGLCLSISLQNHISQREMNLLY